MSRIKLKSRTVVSRPNTLSKMFCLLTGARRPFAYGPSSSGLIIYSGDGRPTPAVSQVATKADHVFLNYYEIWSETQTPTELFLDRCYLHINRLSLDRIDHDPLLALHSDLDCVAPTIENNYKRGPHIHLTAGDHPFHHSHIALSLNDLDETCGDLENLMRSLERNLDMIEHEFFRYL
jgi:hypothetical protein